MKNLNSKLLMTEELQEMNFASAVNGNRLRGSYNPLQSVVRLHDDILKALDRNDMSFERIQAFSTYLHETIHWWQHVGSHLGFITSLSYPALAHMAQRDLKTLVDRNEIYKPILAYDQYYYSQTGSYNNIEVNRILNYYHDIRFATAYISNNENIRYMLKDKRFFLNIGHCFHMLWSMSINVLSVSIDPHFNFLPKIKDWSPKFLELERSQIPGFTTDADVTISSLGTHAIYEGQARFNQLQYLAIGSSDLSYEKFAEMGMLQGIYIEAFDLFLMITGIDRPNSLNNSVIGLFLLICDVAINPVEGFPSDIIDYNSFIISNDPGMRFTLLCQNVAVNKDRWENAVKDYSRDEYVMLSEELCDSIVCLPPLRGSAIAASWAEEHMDVKKMMAEEADMKFSNENLVIRLFISKYIRFQEDKLKYPNIFCWPGKSMTGELSKEIDLETVEKVFEKHQALFTNVVGGEIRPTLYEGISEDNIMDTFNSFYMNNTTYDMTMKWITEMGAFTYDYQWLSPQYNSDDVKNYVRNNFKDVYSIYPEEIKIL